MLNRKEFAFSCFRGWHGVTLGTTIERLLYPVVIVSCLLICAGCYCEYELRPHYIILAILSFLAAYPGNISFNDSAICVLRKLVVRWGVFVCVMVAFGSVTGYIGYYPGKMLKAWVVMTPISYIGAHFVIGPLLRWWIAGRCNQRKAIIVGANEIGLHLAEECKNNVYLGLHVMGFFDDRESDRIPLDVLMSKRGRLDDVVEYVKQGGIDIIYISLPMATQSRIIKLLDELKDTTASIYFVPDIFVADIIQGGIGSVGNVPVVAVCETPFTSFYGITKRLSDIVMSFFILLCLSPLMLVLAIGVKLSSPGPVIFKQRRYGLKGEEIIVYKFRSMTTCDDGAHVPQATKCDPRVTRFGAFIRRTSLDELPQFLNVLQGRMSIVGPRPHAIAHNELYRKLISGYMLRHKVRPGITGWAQVNGYRGETETLEKMEKRVHFDLEYLRKWSLGFDLKIILKTIMIVVKDRNAY